MKRFKLLFVAAALLVGFATVNAQSQVAHIDTQALVEAMPEMKAAQSQLDKLQKTYDTEIKSMVKELEAKMTQYDSEAQTKTDEENQKRVVEVQDMQKNINAYRQQALQDLQQKEVDLFKPILEKARNAIQKVARAQGIQYVLDSANGNGVLLADGTDLLSSVKQELKI